MTARGTLLAKMGFADPDRKEPMHDAACGYLASKALDVHRRFLRDKRAHRVQVEHEHLISRGDGNYKTTVGFVDLVVRCDLVWRHETEYFAQLDADVLAVCEKAGLTRESYLGDRYAVTRHELSKESGGTLGIEVKWKEDSVSGALRQLAVYREYTPGWHWVLAAPWLLNDEQRASLKSQRVHYVRLDTENVRRWAEINRKAAAGGEMVL